MATMSVSEAAEKLGVLPARVRTLIREGKISATHHPTAYRWQIERREIRRYLASKRRRRSAKD